MTINPIFANILKPFGASADTPTGAALGRLGESILAKDLRDKERELTRHMDCGERLVTHVEELQAEISDATLPDYAYDLASHKLTQARACGNDLRFSV